MGPCVSRDRHRRGQPVSELQMIEPRPQPASELQVIVPRPRPGSGQTRSSPVSEPAAGRSRQTLDTVRLHDLPTALQEKILLHSLEPCMARALANSSVSRGKELSNDTIYRVFILLAFFDNEPPLPVKDSHFAPASYQFLTKAQRQRLQSDIVECKWFTVELIEKHVPTLVQLALERECRLHRQAEKTRGNDLSSLPDVNNLEDLVENYLEQYCSVPKRDAGLVNGDRALGSHEDVLRRSIGPGKHVRKSVVFLYVPNRIVDPMSWTQKAKSEFSFVLFRVEPGSGMNANAFERGLNKAIREGDDTVRVRLKNLQKIVRGQWDTVKRQGGRDPWYTSIHTIEYHRPPVDPSIPVGSSILG